MNTALLRRIMIIAGGLVLAGGLLAYIVTLFQSDAGTPVNINITTEDLVADQVAHQQGNQEGDAALYERYVQQLTLGRLGKEQPTIDEQGRVVYRSGDRITYNLVTPNSVTAPFKVQYAVTGSDGVRVATGEPLDMNPGANTACCIDLPEQKGEYTLRFSIDDQLFAARYFVVK